MTPSQAQRIRVRVAGSAVRRYRQTNRASVSGECRDDDRDLRDRPRPDPGEVRRRGEPSGEGRGDVRAHGDDVETREDPAMSRHDRRRGREHHREVEAGRPQEHVQRPGDQGVEDERRALDDVAHGRAQEPRHAAPAGGTGRDHQRDGGRLVRTSREDERRDDDRGHREEDDAPAGKQGRPEGRDRPGDVDGLRRPAPDDPVRDRGVGGRPRAATDRSRRRATPPSIGHRRSRRRRRSRGRRRVDRSGRSGRRRRSSRRHRS